MDTVTYPDPRVAAFIAGHFIPARLRVKESPELMPEDFLAYLSLGVGKCRLNRKHFEQAGERFDEVARRHPGTDAGAEALYWLGVAQYKQTHDPAQLRPSWQRLAQEYPNSECTKRTRIPAKS